MPPKKKGTKGLKMRKAKKGDEEKKDDEEVKASGDDYVEPFYGLIKVQVCYFLLSCYFLAPVM
jgi:hypothetical protein